MLNSEQVEQLMDLVWAMDRPALISQFQHYPSSFPIDFTEEFFDQTPLERLRHIFVALCLQHQQLPEEARA
jgi:hypothetical protein